MNCPKMYVVIHLPLSPIKIIVTSQPNAVPTKIIITRTQEYFPGISMATLITLPLWYCLVLPWGAFLITLQGSDQASPQAERGSPGEVVESPPLPIRSNTNDTRGLNIQWHHSFEIPGMYGYVHSF